MLDLNTTIFQEFQKYGLKATITSVEHINDIKDEIVNLKEQSLLEEQFYHENLYWLNFNYSDTMSNAKSILVLAYPQLMSRLNFEYNERKYTVTVPPTYVYSNVSERVKNILTQVLMPHNYSFKRTNLPAKLLAVRTGLGMYGRNNICYVNGMGSFHRLFSFYTDLPASEDNWREKTVMLECSKCGACIKACPTNCIDSERFLIHAEKCITNFNEKERDFPKWLDKGWHNAIVGCMKCQLICPQNRDFIERAENEVTFESEEIRMILQKMPLAQLPYHLIQKIDSLDLNEYYEILQRNLSIFIK